MKLALTGAGRMGRATRALAEARGWSVVHHADRTTLGEGPDALAERLRASGAEGVIDFSAAAALPTVAAACARAGLHLVTGTTGWEEGDVPLEAVARAGRCVVWGPNFAVGVHVFLRLAREAAAMARFSGGFELDVLERHHRHKRDAPSGTARLLADAVCAAGGLRGWVPGNGTAAEAGFLPVTSVRAGSDRGTHQLTLDGGDERIVLVHRAVDRAAFARGALAAAAWCRGRTGVFAFDAVVEDLMGWTTKPGAAGEETT